MAKTFISYRRSDSGEFAKKLRDHLAFQLGDENVFFDTHTLQVASVWKEVIREELEICVAMVVVIGPQWASIRKGTKRRLFLRDDWTRKEVKRALERQILVLPVLLDGIPHPTKADLPQPLHPLLAIQSLRAKTSSAIDAAKTIAQRIRKDAIQLKIAQKSKYVGSDRDDPNEDWFEWKVWLDGPKSQLDSVRSVLYQLPRDFGETKFLTGNRKGKFSMEREGYDDFKLKAVVEFKNGRKTTVSYWLDLQ